MNYFCELFPRIHMEEEAAAVFTQCAERISAEERKLICEKFFAGESIRDFADELAAKIKIPYETVILTCYLLLSEKTREDYRQVGWPEKVFYDTFCDYSLWAKVGYRKHGYYGMPREHAPWLEKHLRRQLVRLGRLQFEPSVFEEEEYHGRMVSLKKGDPVLNVHIPEGYPFTAELRHDSYRRAVEFFGTNLFACETWFFYAEHRNMLKPTSNIIQFMDEFTILSQHSYPEGPDLWRVFGFLDSYDPANLPRETSFQRAYADHLAKKWETGCGYGIMLYEDGKCMRP